MNQAAATRPSVDVSSSRAGGFWSPRWIALGASLLAAFAVNAPSLQVGLFGDDFVHRRFILERLRGLPSWTAWWNMFDSRVQLAGTEPDPATLFGRLPWWSSPEFSFALFRPLSTASHFLDYLLWPDTPWLMHAHNIVLFGAVVALAADLYVRLLGAGWPAALALFLLALDDANTITTAWIAGRNTLLTAIFALLAFSCFERGSRGSRVCLYLAPVALLFAHASSEGAIVGWAYLVPHCVWFDPRPVASRVRALLPLAAVSLGWLALSAALGYGVRGSGVYIDPRSSPLLFVQAAVQRMPQLFEIQLGVPVELMKELPKALAPYVLFCSRAYLACLLVVTLWAARRSRLVAFFGAATFLSLLPQCAAGGFARLLLLSSFAAHGLIASILPIVLQTIAQRRARTWVVAAWSALLFAVYGVPALQQPNHGREFADGLHRGVLHAASSLPYGPALRDSPIVVLNYPDYLRSVFVALYRRELHATGPERMHVLGVTDAPVRVTRLTADSIQLEPVGGYLREPTTLLVRRATDRFRVGQRFDLGDVAIEVLEVSWDGRPTRISVRSEQFQTGGFFCLYWNQARNAFDRLVLPPLGVSVWLPPVNANAQSRS